MTVYAIYALSFTLSARLSALLLVRFQAALMIPLPVKVVIVPD